MTNLPEYIIEELKRRGISRLAYCRMLEGQISRTHVLKILRGETHPTVPMMEKMLEILGLSWKPVQQETST